MKLSSIYKANYFLLFMGFICLLPFDGYAQKRKKDDGNPVASVKLREAEFYFTEGEKHFILEDYAKALIYYQKSLDISANNATVHYKIAQVLSRSDKREDMLRAAMSIERALSLEKKNKYFYLLAAELYANLTQFDKSSQTYETMFAELPETQDHLYELAAVYQYGNQKEEAIKTYTRAENFSGINEISSLQKARLYFELRRNEEAIREGEKLISAFPDEEQFVVAVAEMMSQYGEKEKSISYLEKFITENKPASSAQLLLAGLYRDIKQEDKARQLLITAFNDPDLELNSKLIVLGTYNAELSNARTKNQSDPSKEKFTLELFSILEKQYSEQENIHILGGDLYLTLGKKPEAQKQYLTAIKHGSTSFEVWQNLLYLETQLEQWDNIITHSEQAMEYHPNQAMLYYFNGIGNLRKKKNREAAQSFEQAKKLASSNPAMTSELNGLLGDAYNASKEYEKSDKAYDEALSYSGNNDVILNNYSYYLALRKTNLEKAEKMSAQLIKNNPENATYLDTYAWVLFVREKYKDARKVIEKAIGTGLASATHFEHYGDILFKLGDVENAVKQWEKAKNMLTTSSETLNKKIANRRIYE
jgi:tetratricopeptide (TPR) repeat protein